MDWVEARLEAVKARQEEESEEEQESKVSNYTFSSFLTDAFVCSASASIDIQHIPLTIPLGVATRPSLQPLLLQQRTEAQQN